jgi:two-component sensor histidine kinase
LTTSSASSELVSNAVQHSGRPKGDPIEYRLTIFPKTILVEVADRGEGTNQLRPRTGTPPSGLGVVELLSDRWAGSAQAGTFNVWLEIDIEPSLIQRKQQ